MHPSALLLMDTFRSLWGVSSKKKNITAGTLSMSTQKMTLSLTATTLVAFAGGKLILPLLTMNQSKLCKENANSPCMVLF